MRIAQNRGKRVLLQEVREVRPLFIIITTIGTGRKLGQRGSPRGVEAHHCRPGEKDPAGREKDRTPRNKRPAAVAPSGNKNYFRRLSLCH